MFNLSAGKKIIFSLIVLFFFLLIAELGIRGVLFFSSFGKKQLDLDPYREPNSKFGWGLKANYRQTSLSPDTGQEELLTINSKGFRGEEFDTEKDFKKTRIIMMGDSVTFGITPEACPYPAQLQSLFNQKYPHKVEVINAGVGGYSSEYVLKRLKYDILQYKPDIITVYVGWNDLYAINPQSPWQYKNLTNVAKFLNHFYLYKAYRKIIFQWLKPKLGGLLDNLKDTPYVYAQYQKFIPEKYIGNLKEIAKVCRDNNIKLVLINLASILKEKMSNEGIKKVHYPYFTSDIQKLILLQNIYNRSIKKIAEEEEVPLIDLAAVFDSIPTKENLFFDTMHPYCSGQKIIAETIYKNLLDFGIITLK